VGSGIVIPETGIKEVCRRMLVRREGGFHFETSSLESTKVLRWSGVYYEKACMEVYKTEGCNTRKLPP